MIKLRELTFPFLESSTQKYKKYKSSKKLHNFNIQDDTWINHKMYNFHGQQQTAIQKRKNTWHTKQPHSWKYALNPKYTSAFTLGASLHHDKQKKAIVLFNSVVIYKT